MISETARRPKGSPGGELPDPPKEIPGPLGSVLRAYGLGFRAQGLGFEGMVGLKDCARPFSRASRASGFNMGGGPLLATRV